MLVHSFIEEVQVGVRPVVVSYFQVHNLQVKIEQYISTMLNQFFS
jgi:hypothetical protein